MFPGQLGDHPRVCGEKMFGAGKGQTQTGSPPRMRGKDNAAFKVCHMYGITPAYAGKRQTRALLNTAMRDHPRVCGEKPTVPAVGTLLAGSPPRMRGKVCTSTADSAPQGITPAYAGKRRLPYSLFEHLKDHPRVCGEKSISILFAQLEEGSPPRMRGKVALHNNAPAPVGITPAYAGKRNLGHKIIPQAQDHPRVCGEKSAVSMNARTGAGSPPRMRGKGLSFFSIISCFGITPAYAGKRHEH